MSVQSISQPPIAAQEYKNKRYPWHAAASFVLPGTGQFIKGDNRTGKIDMGVQAGLIVGSVWSSTSLKKYAKNLNDVNKIDLNKVKKLLAIKLLCVVLGLVNSIQSSINAYKRPKTKES